jgi:hypothetical protein
MFAILVLAFGFLNISVMGWPSLEKLVDATKHCRLPLAMLMFVAGWFMNYIVAGLVILGALVFAVLRLGGGIAAVSGLGYVPASVLPAPLRRFLFGEK